MQESNAENDFANKYKLYRNAKTRKQHAAYDALMTSNNLVSDFALTWDKKILIKTMWHIIALLCNVQWSTILKINKKKKNPWKAKFKEKLNS